MSHMPATNTSGRVLQPDIPPPSLNAENCPPPLNLASQETIGQETTTSKGFWFFKRNNRGGPSSSKPIAPPMTRSLSEPNSPTDPSGAATSSRRKSEEKLNYISLAIQLLNESKVRFDGHQKDWARFHDRYHQLFAMGQPINGKIVKYNTPKPNAQDVAKLLVRDIQAKLEELDAEMEELASEDSSSTLKLKKDIRRAFASTPEPVTGPPLKPWFNPSTINPVVLDKVDKHRSINPEGTWHGHSRSRSTVPSRPLPDFSAYDARNKAESRRAGSETAALNSTHDQRDPARDDLNQVHKEAGERDRKKDKDLERERDRRREVERDRERGDAYGRERERERERGDSDRDRPRDKDGDREQGDSGPSKGERGRKDRQRHHRDNTPRLEYPPRPGSVPRERQMSDPAIYTRSSHRRNPSPESLAPAIYTLAEDVEVREGTSSVTSRDPVPIGVPRIPTVVAYPGNEEEELNAIYGGGKRSGPNGGDRLRRGPTPTVASNAPGTSGLVANGSETGHPHRRRRRSRSLGHELDGRVNRNSPRSGSPKKDRTVEKEWEREREREGEKEKQRERDRKREEREREREKGGGRDRVREERDRERDHGGERERNKDKSRQRDRDREKEWDRDKGKEKEKVKGGEKDTEREREKEPYKYENMRPAYQEERERYDSRGRRNREREKDKDRDRDHERERGKGLAREKDRYKDYERETEQDFTKDRNKDRENEYNNHRSEGEQPPNAPPPTQSANMAGAQGPAWLAPPTSLSLHPTFQPALPETRLFPPNPNSDSRFLEILTSPAPPILYDLPGPR